MHISYKDYSVIIPFHSGNNYLQACISTLTRTLSEEVEIIIVSSNNAQIEFDITRPNTKIIRDELSLTYPQAVNLGVAHSKGKFLIFCDADTCYVDFWFEKLTEFHHANPSVGISSSKLLDPYTGRILDFGIAFTQYNAPHIGRDRKSDFPLFSFDREVQAACSANMIISRTTFEKVNGFNTTLSHSYCDLDLCLRLRENGYKIAVVADSIVYHRGGSSDTAHEFLKNDVKAKFWALNNSRICLDMEEYWLESYEYFSKNNAAEAEYMLVDLSTIADRSWCTSAIKKIMGPCIVDLYEHPMSLRDSRHYELYGKLSWNILNLRFPIIYFVDRFVSIVENNLWWKNRPVNSDMVIDRNGNIDLIKNIL